MSMYTTGELAKLCGITVRTVQYYDTRGILSPSALSEGGRRLYSDDDLRRMHIVCFLRETGLPINSIAALFAEENPKILSPSCFPSMNSRFGKNWKKSSVSLPCSTAFATSLPMWKISPSNPLAT